MPRLNFTVDSALLRELGERLIGRAHIALAELIKNSFDADATTVEVEFLEDAIRITDDGEGMDFAAFESYWMRVGSPHKRLVEATPRFGRRLTGSKGIGRLSTQFLARGLTLRTTSRARPESELVASVDWEEATIAGDLTKAWAEWESRAPAGTYAGGSRHGTELILTSLVQPWSDSDFEDLGREVWALQPPFRITEKDKESGAFEVKLTGPTKEETDRFESQMHAILGIWSARIVGRLLPPEDPSNPDRTMMVSLVKGRDLILG